MLILKHLKNAPTCFDHYSDHLQGARKFLLKSLNLNIFLNFKILKGDCGDAAAAASPQSPQNFKNFRFSDFNKEPTSSLKMIRIMIETCWSVFKCFNINILG